MCRRCNGIPLCFRGTDSAKQCTFIHDELPLSSTFVDDIWRGLNQSVRVWFTINQTETLKANNNFWDRTWCILTKLFNNYIFIIMICNRSNPFLILQKWLFKRITKSITKINQIFFIPMDEATTKLYTAQCRHKIGQLLSPNYFPISC